MSLIVKNEISKRGVGNKHTCNRMNTRHIIINAKLMGKTVIQKTTIREKLVKKFSSVQLLAMSFGVVILCGSILLSLPISNKVAIQPYINNLFVAVSAVCVTGLTPIVIVDQYTVFGQVILMILMQIGGLGLMTFLALFITAARKKMNYAEKQLLADSTSKTDMSKVPEYVKRIVKYTFFFEMIGFVLLCIRLIPEYGPIYGMFNSLFLSVSAFCNAGIDNISAVSMASYVSDPLVSLTIMGLIVTGGLGFVIWFDLSNHLKEKRKTHYSPKTLWQHLNLHTKLVVTVTSVLLVSGFLLIFVLEYNNPQTLGGLDFGSKVLAAAFQSVTLRTAGFSTLNIGELHPATQFLMCIFMLIGGSPGGTAGGIKTTTVAAFVILVGSTLHQNDCPHCFKREISQAAFQKAFVTFMLFLCALIAAITLMSAVEGQTFSFLAIMFECFSAIGTVGLSMGITPALSSASKIIIMLLMFIGRIGPITLVLSFIKNRRKKVSGVKYPDEDIIIG